MLSREHRKTYQVLATEFYDLTEHIHHDEALAFYQEKAAKSTGPILEPMCGSGRFLIPLLRAGYDIEGFDASLNMLAALREKCVSLGIQEPCVWHGYVEECKHDKKYGLIFIPYGSWGLMTSKHDALCALKTLCDHLMPRGRLIIELETVASVAQTHSPWRHGTRRRPDGSKIILNASISYDHETRIFCAHSVYESVVQGATVVTETEDFRQYLYTHDELDAMLQPITSMRFTKYPAYNPTQSVTTTTPTIIYECLRVDQ